MQTYFLQYGLRHGHKDWGSLANEPGHFIATEQHFENEILEEFQAQNWRAAREYVADTHFM